MRSRISWSNSLCGLFDTRGLHDAILARAFCLEERTIRALEQLIP